MRLHSALSTATVFLFAVLALAANSAGAASPGGKFTLPFTAVFGSATLPPGEYTFTVLSNFGTIAYLDVRGKTASAFILPMAINARAGGAASHLAALTVGNEHFIESLTLKEAGMTFRFRLPKRARVPATFTNIMAPARHGS